MRFRLLYTTGPDDATNRYRALHLAEALREEGHEATHGSVSGGAVSVGGHLTLLHRLRWDTHGAALTTAARAAGARVVYSADDLVFDLEYAYHTGMLHPDDPLRYRHSKREALANAELLRQADAVLVSTEFLAERARALTPRPVAVVRNFLGDELQRRSEEARAQRLPRESDRVVLGYLSGSPTHDRDLADIAEPLAAALRRHAGARLLVVGAVNLPAPLQPLAESGRVLRHPGVPWRELPGLIAGIDINLAPLDTTRPFNHAKSEIKFLEAAAVGVPTVGAPALGFAEALTEGEGCLLPRTLAQWAEALDCLLADPARRAELAERARASLARRGTAATDGCRAAQVLASLAEGGAPGAERTVRATSRQRFWGAVFGAEARIVRRVNYLRRHLRLIQEQERHGGGTE